MIYTSNYDNAKKGNLISISYDEGVKKDFKGSVCRELMPKKLFYEVWEKNKELVDSKINEHFFINQYYYQVIRQVNLNLLLKTLGEDPILLCYENPYEFSHRFLIAAYLEIKLGIDVPELIIDEYGNYKTTNYKPFYLKDKMLRLVQTHER